MEWNSRRFTASTGSCARPDLKNPRTCDSVAEMIYGVMKNGKFQVAPVMSVDENYRKTIISYGLQKEYNLK